MEKQHSAEQYYYYIQAPCGVGWPQRYFVNSRRDQLNGTHQVKVKSNGKVHDRTSHYKYGTYEYLRKDSNLQPLAPEANAGFCKRCC